jgi:hypothetical protein
MAEAAEAAVTPEPPATAEAPAAIPVSIICLLRQQDDTAAACVVN